MSSLLTCRQARGSGWELLEGFYSYSIRPGKCSAIPPKKRKQQQGRLSICIDQMMTMIMWTKVKTDNRELFLLMISDRLWNRDTENFVLWWP